MPDLAQPLVIAAVAALAVLLIALGIATSGSSSGISARLERYASGRQEKPAGAGTGQSQFADLLAQSRRDKDTLDRLNLVARDREVRAALALSEGRGAIAVNVMKAVNAHAQYVRQSCESGAHAIVMGAGLPLDLPELASGFPEVALIPILSEPRGVSIVLRKWMRRNRLPDAIVIEHPGFAGGHLGATRICEVAEPRYDFEPVLEGVFSHFDELGLGRDRVPVIVAGGIHTHEQVRSLLALGAAHQYFKRLLAEAKPEALVPFTSVAGLPARAVATPWLSR